MDSDTISEPFNTVEKLLYENNPTLDQLIADEREAVEDQKEDGRHGILQYVFLAERAHHAIYTLGLKGDKLTRQTAKPYFTQGYQVNTLADYAAIAEMTYKQFNRIVKLHRHRDAIIDRLHEWPGDKKNWKYPTLNQVFDWFDDTKRKPATAPTINKDQTIKALQSDNEFLQERLNERDETIERLNDDVSEYCTPIDNTETLDMHLAYVRESAISPIFAIKVMLEDIFKRLDIPGMPREKLHEHCDLSSISKGPKPNHLDQWPIMYRDKTHYLVLNLSSHEFKIVKR